MKFRLTHVLPLALAAGLVASPAVLAKDKKAEVEEAGSVAASEIKLPKPPAGQGQIVFYRKGGIVGAAVACSVWENGQKISSMGGGRYFVMVAAPGKHTFSVKTEAKDVLTLEVEPDETQFVECKIKMGMMVGRPDIRPVKESDFRAAKKFKMTDADDMGPGPGALRPDEYKAALEASK